MKFVPSSGKFSQEVRLSIFVATVLHGKIFNSPHVIGDICQNDLCTCKFLC